jgi:ribosome biogenesis protein Tsr3
VEVKNQLKKDDVDEHLERLEKCVAYPPRGTEGKILLGAVATMIISKEVETYAQKKGFFVIKASGKAVKIANLANFQGREWQTKG